MQAHRRKVTIASPLMEGRSMADAQIKVGDVCHDLVERARRILAAYDCMDTVEATPVETEGAA